MAILGILVVLFIGYTIGVYSERVAWNKLIEDGKIPKPKGK